MIVDLLTFEYETTMNKTIDTVDLWKVLSDYPVILTYLLS